MSAAPRRLLLLRRRDAARAGWPAPQPPESLGVGGLAWGAAALRQRGLQHAAAGGRAARRQPPQHLLQQHASRQHNSPQQQLAPQQQQQMEKENELKLTRELFERLRTATRAGAVAVDEARAWEEARTMAEEARGDCEVARAWAARRCAGQDEPLAYVMGCAWFWTLRIQVTRDVLIPRPCSEVLVERAVAHLRTLAAPRLLDVCAGPGTLGLAALAEVPRARGLLLDVSEPALAVARRNAEHLGLLDRCALVCADVLRPFALARAADAHTLGPADVVLCNPPYIASDEIETLDASVRAHEPRLALDGGKDGLDYYRAVALRLRELVAAGGVAPGGQAVLELGMGQRDQVVRLMTAHGFSEPRVFNDLAGIERCLVLPLAPT
jgi:release factor glutamine methyltransferase